MSPSGGHHLQPLASLRLWHHSPTSVSFLGVSSLPCAHLEIQSPSWLRSPLPPYALGCTVAASAESPVGVYFSCAVGAGVSALPSKVPRAPAPSVLVPQPEARPASARSGWPCLPGQVRPSVSHTHPLCSQATGPASRMGSMRMLCRLWTAMCPAEGRGSRATRELNFLPFPKWAKVVLISGLLHLRSPTPRAPCPSASHGHLLFIFSAPALTPPLPGTPPLTAPAPCLLSPHALPFVS